MLLRLQHALRVGERVEVAVDLAPPGKSATVELAAQGRIVRVEPGCVAIQFERQDLKRTPLEERTVRPRQVDLPR